MTTFDTFPVTVQGLGENPKEKIEPEHDQDDEKEQSLSDSLQVRRQNARVYENMEHPSNRTVVRVLRLGGAKHRFVLAAAKHSYGACEAQKRPVGPIVSRSPNSLVFNDVVVLDLVFFSDEKHNILAMNIVCWGIAVRCSFRDQPGDLEDRI